MVLQIYIYFLRYPKDPLPIKILVGRFQAFPKWNVFQPTVLQVTTLWYSNLLTRKGVTLNPYSSHRILETAHVVLSIFSIEDYLIKHFDDMRALLNVGWFVYPCLFDRPGITDSLSFLLRSLGVSLNVNGSTTFRSPSNSTGGFSGWRTCPSFHLDRLYITN
jgi:hypothetical protein